MEKVILLKAGEEIAKTEQCSSFVLVSTGGSKTLEISFLDVQGQVNNTFKESLKLGFTFDPPNGMANIRFKSDTDARIVYIVTRGGAKVNIIDGAQLNARITNTIADPVPVMMTGEVEIINDVGNSLPVTVENFPDVQKVNVIQLPPVVIPLFGIANRQGEIEQAQGTVQLAPFNDKRTYWLIRNVSPTKIYLGIGGANLNADNAVRVLQTGDVWYEETPEQAAQSIHLRVLPKNGSYPYGTKAIYTFEERTL